MASRQEQALEALAGRHDSIRCTPLADGSIRADCLDRTEHVGAATAEDTARAAGWCPPMRYTHGWIVKPDGTKESVAW